jgi:four helix bundle protein
VGLINYEDLDVYKLAFEQALALHKLSLEFPKIEQFGGMADQMRRCSKGICANVAEGLSKQMSVADKKRFIQMALGSAEETRVWLAFSTELGYLEKEQGAVFRSDYLRIAQMLYQLQKTLKF